MPTYDYECDACGHKFELYQSIMAEVETKCPSCKKKKLRRLIGTGAAIVFKGSGFYQTDYRSDSYKKSASSDKTSSDSSATSEGSKSETKSTVDSSSSKSEPTSKTESTGKSESASKKENKTPKKSPKPD